MGPKRRRNEPLQDTQVDQPFVEENARTFLDVFGDDFAGDGNLSDTEVDYGENSDSDSDNEAISSDEEIDNNSDDEDIRTAAPRKQKFRNLDEVLDESKYDSLPEQPNETYTWKSRDKNDPESYTWTTNFNSAGRPPRRNHMENVPGPTPYAKRCKSLRELFDAFITDDMISDVVEYTNQKVTAILQDHPEWQSSKYPYIKVTDSEEIHAFFGHMYIRAVLRQNLLSVKRLYQHRHSNPIFKAILSENRFVFLCSIIQFDNIQDRNQRWEQDRFTAFRDFFNSFNDQCAQLRIPSDLLSLDETLYPYRGRISIKQYNPNKPAKYGLLYRSISDAEKPYTYNTLPYAGKPHNITPQSEYVTGTDNYTKYLVKGLERQVNIKGRNLSIDRYFTSVTIAEWLLNRGLTVVGTLRHDRRGIPEGIKKVTGRDDKSTKYFYCEGIKSIMVSYAIKKKTGWKNVLVLSSMHKNVKITQDERRKPDVISFYDHTKGGVDIMDQMAGVFTTRCKTRRWTMNALSYVLDTVRTNANTLWNEMYPAEKLSSHDFLWALSDELIKPFVQRRYDNRIGLTKPIVLAMMDVLGIKEYVPLNFNPGPPAPKRRCFFCLLRIHGEPHSKVLKDKLGKFKFICGGTDCGKTLCHEHMNIHCDDCLENMKVNK